MQMNQVDHARSASEDLARSGGRDAPIEIVEYDLEWPDLFASERERIAPLLDGAEIHHIGSTAVPGLAVKRPTARASWQPWSAIAFTMS